MKTCPICESSYPGSFISCPVHGIVLDDSEDQVHSVHPIRAYPAPTGQAPTLRGCSDIPSVIQAQPETKIQPANQLSNLFRRLQLIFLAPHGSEQMK
jgi:hypothetical protein